MSQSHRLIHNTSVIWLTRFLRYIPELLLVPFIIKNIGADAFGVYVLAWSILTAMERMQEPVTSAVVKYGAGYLAQNNTPDVNRIASTAFSIATLIAGIISLCVLIAAFVSPDLLHHDSQRLQELTFYCLLAVAGTIIASYPLMPFVGIMYARQRHDLFFLLDTAAAYFKALLVVLWFTILQPSAIALILITGLAFFLPRFVMALRANRAVPGLKIQKKSIDAYHFRLIFSFAGVLFLASLCYIVNFTGIKWVMGIVASTAFVAHLEIILIPSRVVGQLTHGMTLTVMPAASKLDALEDTERLNELFIRGTRYICVIIILEIIAASLLLKPLLLLWMGGDYLFLHKYLFLFFCFNAVHTMGYCANQIMRGGGKLRAVFWNSLIGQALVPVGATLLLYGLTQDPYWTAAIGLSAGAIVYGLVQVVSCQMALETPRRDLLQRAFVQPTLIGAPFFLGGLFISLQSGGLDLFPGVLACCLAALLFLAAFYFIFATADEKALAAAYITRRAYRTRP